MTTVSISRVQVLARVPFPANSSAKRVQSIFTTVKGGTPYRPREKETRNRAASIRLIASKARRAFLSQYTVLLLSVIFT
jgi:hypothetical protein